MNYIGKRLHTKLSSQKNFGPSTELKRQAALFPRVQVYIFPFSFQSTILNNAASNFFPCGCSYPDQLNRFLSCTCL